MTDNMRIWDAVSKTNPANTKQVNQRGGFTAINANSQIMDATRQFGPLGIGWGYDNALPIFEAGMVIIPVTLWHGCRANRFGPVFGAEEVAPKGRLDTDAPKKAATDGLTKLLSQLGFNADVFLGKYDDQKYVAELKREFAPPPPVISDAQYAEIITLLQTAGADVKLFLKHYGVATVNELPADMFVRVTAALNRKITDNAKAASQ
jgi:hypothetical protein